MITLINVVCGRFRRAGDDFPDVLPWRPQQQPYAQVIPPVRSWDSTPKSGIRRARHIFGEMMTCNLADEILTPGAGQINAMINGSANMASVPDQRKMLKALDALHVFVTIEP